MSYFPLDRDLLTSSLWALGSPQAVKVWIYLLLNANPRTGVVEDAAPAIALRCGLPLDETVEALGWLSSPDAHSRTKDFEGRRIEERPEGGYRILNYRRRQDKDHSTERVKRFRERKAGKRPETVVKRHETVTGTTNKNTNTETEERREEPTSLLAPVVPILDRAEAATNEHIRRLQLELGALLARLEEHPNSRRRIWDWCREVTAYDKPDGTRVKGIADFRTIFRIDRLERSIEDAKWHLEQLGGEGAQRGA